MSGGGAEKQTLESEPWAEAKPYILDFMKRAGGQADIPLEYGPNRIAGQSADTVQSYDMVRELMGGSSVNQMNTFLGEVLGGEFMGGQGQNPLLDETFDVMSSRIGEAHQRIRAPQTASRFAGAGQGGSSGYMGADSRDSQILARELGDLGTQIYYGDYEARMGDRFKAAGMAPGGQSALLEGIGAMSASGRDQDAYSQSLLDDAIQRFAFAQSEPEQRLDRFGTRIGQISQPYGSQEQLIPTGSPGLSAGMGVLGLLGQLGGAAIMAG